MSLPAPECLARNGDLGVVPLGRRYRTMTSTGERVSGLLTHFAQDCRDGCTLHEVDSIERRLVRTWIFRAEFWTGKNFRLVYDGPRRRVIFPVAQESDGQPDVWELYIFELD